MIIDGGKPAIDQDIAPTAPVDQASVTSVAKYVFTAIWGADFNILPGYNASATPTPTSCTSGPGSTCTSQPLPVGGQQIALASYIHPLADPDAWVRLFQYPNDKITVLVANVLNGPDSTLNTDWQTTINKVIASGKTIIGYVRTGYLGVPPDGEYNYDTRLGSRRLSDWIAQIEHDVDMWYELYGTGMGGIFFDEGWNECGLNNQYAEVYRRINENTKRKYPGAYTVLNPGTKMPQCFEHSADTLLTYESSYDNYLSGPVYSPLDWTPSDPRKIWHIIYGVPQSDVAKVAALAHERGAGLIEITDDSGKNPYDTLPDNSYMQLLMNSIGGGAPAVASPLPNNNNPGPGPGNGRPCWGLLDVKSFDYSSADLSFSICVGTEIYDVYVNGKLYVRLSAGMLDVKIGDLQPGTQYSFYIHYLAPDEKTSFGSSETRTITTLALPDGLTVINNKVSISKGSTTISADILVPYAFLRLFIWDRVNGCDWDKNPAWPINKDNNFLVCTHYMVEGKTLHKYSGLTPPGFKNAPWTWTPIDSVPIVVSGYTHTWTLPIGSSTTNTDRYVIQAQGYGPYTNIFNPDPDKQAYTCSGIFSSSCSSQPNLRKWCDETANDVLVRTDDLTYGTV
jgi:hypothetical protein